MLCLKNLAIVEHQSMQCREGLSGQHKFKYGPAPPSRTAGTEATECRRAVENAALKSQSSIRRCAFGRSCKTVKGDEFAGGERESENSAATLATVGRGAAVTCNAVKVGSTGIERQAAIRPEAIRTTGK